jgi:hypothetical protein
VEQWGSGGVGQGKRERSGGVSQSESRRNFVPTDRERRVLLELLQSPQESLVSIANEFKITLAALTIYLATDDAATLFAQADLANARRARTAAAAQLEQCIGALSLMISDWVTDVTHNLRRETPESRREQDREQESTRRAATLLYRIANFTPKTLTVPTPTPPPAPNASPLPAPRGEVPESARGWGAVRGRDAHLPPATSLSSADIPASTNPTRQRGVTDATIAPPDPESQQLPSPPASTSPERQRVGASAFTSDIRHPTSDIRALPSPERERAGPPLIPLTISATPRPNRALIPQRRAPDTPSHCPRPTATVPP